MASVTVLVCDHCGTMEDVLNYDIRWDGNGEGHLDLCAEGRKPLEALLALEDGAKRAEQAAAARRVTTKKAASQPRRGRTGLSKVTSMDEIEKQKG